MPRSRVRHLKGEQLLRHATLREIREESETGCERFECSCEVGGSRASGKE